MSEIDAENETTDKDETVTWVTPKKDFGRAISSSDERLMQELKDIKLNRMVRSQSLFKWS